MKRMARRVIARHPDDTFYYADDLTGLSWKEVGKLLLGGLVGLLWTVVILFAISFAGTT